TGSNVALRAPIEHVIEHKFSGISLPQIGGVLIWFLCLVIVAGWVFYPFAHPSPFTNFGYSTLNVTTHSPQVGKFSVMGVGRLRLENIPVSYESVKMHELSFFIDGLPKIIVNILQQKRRSLNHATGPGLDGRNVHIHPPGTVQSGRVGDFGPNLGLHDDCWGWCRNVDFASDLVKKP